MLRLTSRFATNGAFRASPAPSRPSVPGSTHRAFAHAASALLGALLPLSVSALPLDESHLVYREDLVGETAFPTTPDLNVIAAPGLGSVSVASPPVSLSGGAASIAWTVTGVAGPDADSRGAWLDLDLSSSTLGARSVALRGRFENLSLVPAIPHPTVSPQLSMGLRWQIVDLPPYAVAFLVPTNDGDAPRFFLIARNADFSGGFVTVVVPDAQAEEIRAGEATTIDLTIDHDALLVTAALHQAAWPTLTLQIPMPIDLLDPPIAASMAFGAVRDPFSAASGSGSVDADLIEVYAAPQRFAVDSVLDQADQTPGDAQCRTVAGACTLRAAIQESNALPGRQRIEVPSGVHPLSLVGADEDLAATGDLDILDDLELVGSGAGATIVDAGGIDRVFEIVAAFGAPIVSLDGLTIRNGSAATAAGATGGGIENGGELTLTDCEVAGNVANLAGGIMNRRALHLDGCVIRDNEAVPLGFTNARVGGIASASTSAGGTNPVAEIRRSAIVRNRAPTIGGIELGNCASARVENSTIASNQGTQVSIFNCSATFHHATVSSPSGIAVSAGSIGGTRSLKLSNSVFEGLPACSLSPTFPVLVTEDGRNASNDASCALGLPGDVIGVPLGLYRLAAWGGSEARVPQAASPVLDVAFADSACLAEDQVAEPRPRDGDGDGVAHCDLGAVEVPEPELALALAAGWMGLLMRRRSRAPTHR